MQLGNYKNPRLLEVSFREFLSDVRADQRGLFHGFDRKAFVHGFKNMVHHSFFDLNIFDDSEFFQNGEVVFKRSVLDNSITEQQWRENYRIKAEYVTKLDAVCIPLFADLSGRFIQARLVIASPTYGPVQYAVQTRVSGSTFWGTHHCTAHTVNRTIKALIG